MNGKPLNPSWLAFYEANIQLLPHQIEASPRIGVAYAAEDAALPYRFTYSNYNMR